MKKALHIAVFLLIIPLYTCDESFTPLAENDKYFFTIYGYLDVMADTQWVRVGRVRDKIYQTDKDINATVTLINLDTGQEFSLNDSLFVIENPNTPDDYIYRNFWTLEPILPTSNYKIQVTGNDGKTSSATIQTPEIFPEPEFERPYVVVRELDHPAEVVLEWEVRNDRNGDIKRFRFPYTERAFTNPGENGKLFIRIDPAEHIPYLFRVIPDEDNLTGYGEITILSLQLKVVSAGPEWINFSELDSEVIALPDYTSNIQNGVGYFVGTVSHRLIYTTCPDDASSPIPCTLNNTDNYPYWDYP